LPGISEESSVKIGVQIGQVVARGYDLQRQWQEQLEQFRACRDAGFDFISWGHHWLIDPFQHFQPIPVLARFAAEAGAMDLVTGVLLTPLLNPVQVAEDIATLDHICRGQLILGVGLGYRSEEFEAAGSKMSERVPRFEEGLALMKRLWADDEVTHHGRFYRVTGARPTARPYQRPYPRIWIAAMTEPAYRRAGRLGHPFYALGTLTHEQLRDALTTWRAALRESGQAVPAEIPIHREFYVAQTREAARAKARPAVEAKYRGYAQHGLPSVGASLATAGVEGLMDDPFVIGAPDECVEKLARLAELGATHLALRLFWPGMTQAEALGMIELTAARVLPALQKL
jgi:alkanesulfonate monooxygenase SsuD/methylene tetrahydromethanopterin reductase-like flavin-dependent oxidoreductase (luciferase family)